MAMACLSSTSDETVPSIGDSGVLSLSTLSCCEARGPESLPTAGAQAPSGQTDQGLPEWVRPGPGIPQGTAALCHSHP